MNVISIHNYLMNIIRTMKALFAFVHSGESAEARLIFRIVTIIIIVVMIMPAPISVLALQSVDVPVLMYHHVQPIIPGNYNPYWVDPSVFSAQLDALQAYGYTTISPDEYFAIRNGTMTSPAKPVLITFDDGYKDFYDYAYPILQAHNMKATSFLITGSVEDNCAGRVAWDSYMCWDEVRAMDKTLITIGSHTVTHPALSSLTPAQQLSEIADSKTKIESEIPGYTISYLAYPYGDGANDPNVQLALTNSGYIGAFSTESFEANTANSPVYDIPRFNVDPNANTLDPANQNIFFLQLIDPNTPIPYITVNSIKAYDSFGVEQTTFLPGQTVTIKVFATNTGDPVNAIASLAIDVDQDDSTSPLYDSHAALPTGDVTVTPFPANVMQTLVFNWTIPTNAQSGPYYVKFNVLDQSYTMTYKDSSWQSLFTVPASASTCNILTLSHTGSGNDPIASPAKSVTCANNSTYEAGELITLTADPNNGYVVTGWAGTDNNTSNAITNTLTMPTGNRTATVNYAYSSVGNDDFNNATVVGNVPYTITQDTTNATLATDDPTMACVGRTGEHTVWYQYTPTANGTLTVDTTGSLKADGSVFDTILAVWTGTRGGLNLVGCNDDGGGNSTSRISTPVSAGVTYYIEAAGYSQFHFGNLVLNVSGPTPVACYALTLNHSGQGTNPIAVPDRSVACAAGSYVVGESIQLSGANPVTDWQIGSWTGTSNDPSTANVNSLNMPSKAQTVSVNYIPVNHPPVFISTPITSATESLLYTYNITVTDPDLGSVITIPAPDTKPAWLTLTDNGNGTAVLSGTPGLGDVGTSNVILQATDGTNIVYQPFSITVGYSTIPPTVTVDQAAGQADPTNTTPIQFTVVFSKPVTGFTGSDVVLGGTAGATTATVMGSGTTYTVDVSGMTSSGTVTASIPAGAALDPGNNANLASTSSDNSVAYDATAPSVTIDQAAGQADPTNATPIQFTVVFSKSVTGFTGGDVVLSGSAGATTATVTGSGTTYTVDVSGMTSSGTVTASISAGAAQDGLGNLSTASTSTDNSVAYDTTAPTVTIDQAVGQADPTNATPIQFAVVFSKPVTGFTGGDVVLSGSAGATTATVTGSSTTYTVDVSGMTSSGTVTASISAGAAQDGLGNLSTASTSTDNSVAYDATAPSVTIDQAAGQADPTNATPIQFTVVFSKSVTGFTGGDVVLSGSAGATTATVTGSGATYTVDVSGMTSSGTVTASISAGAAQDGLGNLSTASTSTDNSVAYDTTAPTVTIDQAVGQADPTNATPIQFAVVFSKPVTGFTGGDVVLSGSAGATTATVTGSSTTYTVDVSGMTSSGTVTASISAGAAQDGLGNLSTASTSTDNSVAYDATAPSVTIDQAAGQADPTNATPIQFTVVFNKPVTGFTGSDVVLGGSAGATTATVTGSGATYTVDVSGMTSSGTVTASISAGAAQDGLGNLSTASTSTDNSVAYDTTAPTVTIDQAVGQADPTNATPIQFTVVFSKPVTGFTGSDVVLGGSASATTATVTGSGTTYTVDVSGMTSSGTVTASIPAGAAQDGLGNLSTASTSTDNSVTYDTTSPLISNIARADTNPTNATLVDFSVIFSENVTGVSASNFDLSTIGLTGASITSVTGSGTTYTVKVNTGSGSGTIGLNMANGTGVADKAGNLVSNFPFTGEVYTIVKINPVVSTIARADPSPTAATSVTFAITFSKSVIGVGISNFSLATTGVSGATITNISGSGTSYTAVVNVGTGSGTVGLDLTDSTGILDSTGNSLGNAPFTGEVYVIDLTAPMVIANGISSVPVAGDGHIDELEIVDVAVEQILVKFNEDVNNPINDTAAEDVTNPKNFLLVRDNGDGIQTSSCIAGATGGDIAVLVDSVSYDNGGGSGPFVATLNLNSGNALPNGVYRLIVCGTTSITDLAGNKLAGDGSNTKTDFVRNFVIASTGVSSSSGSTKTSNKSKLAGVNIPVTGFAPNTFVNLPSQPLDKAYAAYSGLVLEIPSLSIKLDIVGVPQTKDGWDVTWLENQAGYLNGSAFPTTLGNSVITAHVWDAFNNPGSFFGLKNLSYGNKILIHAWGKVYTYEVRTSTLVSPTNIMAVMKHEDVAWITLVTCESFNSKTNNYTYRRLVGAVLISVANEK